MSVLNKQDIQAQPLALFNKVQSKSVLFIAQEDPYSINDHELILKFGLSLASIKNHFEHLNICIGEKSLELSKNGVDELLKIAVAIKDGMCRYEAVVKYHKLVDLPTFLRLTGFSVEQLITVLNLLKSLGNDPQQTMAQSVLSKIPSEILLVHKDYSDELTEKIYIHLTQKKAHI